MIPLPVSLLIIAFVLVWWVVFNWLLNHSWDYSESPFKSGFFKGKNSFIRFMFQSFSYALTGFLVTYGVLILVGVVK